MLRILPLLALALCTYSSPRAQITASDLTKQEFVTFSINVQDFSYPDRSIAIVRRIIALHEQKQVPVDIYLTETMLDIYERDAPDILTSLRTSSYVAPAYHLRPPKPYYTNYDWSGLKSRPYAEQVEIIRNYESKGLDLTTGQPTTAEGSYAKYKRLMGFAPIIAAFQTDAELLDPTMEVFTQMGASFSLEHGSVYNLGDRKKNGLYLRPEHFDLKLFHDPVTPAATQITNALASAHAAAGGRAPYVVGIKMHDNDFFAVDSAWNTVYVATKRPPWNPALRSALLSQAEQDAQWANYEAAVNHVAASAATLGVLNGPRMKAMVETFAANRPLVYVSGTMHIESTRTRWPAIDPLLAFFQRAVAAGRVGNQTTGMRFSIGADIGWLDGEPRARELLLALAALGVEIDVHGRDAAGRAAIAEKLAGFGITPTAVSNGNVLTDIDAMRAPARSTTGFTWTARDLWGTNFAAGHCATCDNFSYGLYRPRSSALWSQHDPAGNLVLQGGGTQDVAGVEALVAAVGRASGGSFGQPVHMASLIIDPQTLRVKVTGDDISGIEAMARRIGIQSHVRWATPSETGGHWIAAGSVPTRITSLTSQTPLNLAPSEYAMAFGTATVGAAVTRTLSLSNLSASGTAIATAAATGDFAVQTHTCQNLPAGGSCTLTLVFTPGGTGNRTGSLSLTPSDYSASLIVPLSGAGQAAATGDMDGDGIPDGVEASVGRNPAVRDNDVFASPTLFAMQQYRDFLKREGDASGVGYWAGELQAGRLSRAAMVEAFLLSGEFETRVAPIARLYLAFFGRVPDYPGLAGWSSALASGTALAVIADAFAASSEFTSTYGSLTDGAFIDLVYRNVLGRSADAAGHAFWLAELSARRITRGGLMAAFSESEESRAGKRPEVNVIMCYAGMLQRSADTEGYTYWVAAIRGGRSVRELIEGFLGSAEYRARFL